jgi:hypothetical protein
MIRMKRVYSIWCLILVALLCLRAEMLKAETTGTDLPIALADSLSDCDSPNALHVSSVAGSSAMIVWSPSTTNLPNCYVVRYKADAQPVWTEVATVDTFLVLTGLERATRYCVDLFYVCGFDTILSSSVCFSTLHYFECLETDPNPINITGSPQLDVGMFPISGVIHSYMEQIVRAYELSPDSSPVLLTGVSYQYTSPSPLNNKDHVEIYLTHREDSVYSNNVDFTPLTEATLVYVGDFYCQLGWNYFEFSTPFYFDGVHNLVIFVIDKTGDTISYSKVNSKFKCHRILNNKVSLGWVSTSPIDLNAPFLPTADFIRNNMRFTVCSHIDSNSCTPPNIYHYECSNDSISVSWVSGLEDTAWVLRYRMVTDDSWTYDSAATSPYKIHAQSLNDLYGFEIQSKCNDSLYSVWKSPFSTEETPCLPVNDITLSSVTEHTAEITWTAGGSENYWFYYPTTDFSSPAPPPANEGWIFTDNPLLLDSLAEGHCYRLWIRAGCGAGNVSSAQPFEFWTECQEITLPYTEDFDHPDSILYLGFHNSGPLPHCWRKLSPYLDAGPYCTSDSCLTFTSSSNEYYVAILPRISDALLIDHLKMNFSYRKLQYHYHTSIVVGVMDDPTDLSTFTSVDTVTTSGNHWDWLNAEVFFENYSGSGRYISLKYQNSSLNTIKVDNLTIDTAFTCHTPTNLMATGISPTSISVTWEDEGSENEWQVALVPDYLTDPVDSLIVTVHEKHHLFTNLTDSNYVFFLRTRCANGWGYSEWVSVPVSTFSHDPAEVPYFHDFENGSENAAWRVENGNFVNRWYIGIPNGYNDSLLFITNNYGVDASYSNSQSVAWAYRDFFFSAASEYEVKFRWLCHGNTNYGYMQAFAGEPAPIPVSQSYSNTLYPDGAELLGKYALQDNWETDRYVFGSEYDNTLLRLYFLWRNASYSAYPPGAVIDYVQIIPYHCVRPSDLTLDFVDDHNAYISFSPTLNDITTWEYVVLEGDSFPDDSLPVLTTSITSVSLSGLSENTSYTLYIRGVCSNGYHSSWAEIKFKTECSPLVLPYVETFDVTEGSKFECWSFLAPETGIQRPSIYKPTQDWEVDTNPVLRFYGIGPNHALAILPEVPSDYSVNSLRLSFLMYRNVNKNRYLIVGVMSDPDNFQTFVPVDTVQTVEPFAVNHKEVYFDHYQGSGTYIAIFSDTVGDNTCHIDVDDLVLEIAPSCLAPSGLKAINMGQNSATLSWTPANDEQAWEVAYGTDDFNPDSTQNICVVNTNPFTLTGLDEGTFYGFYVRALCSSGEYSEWSPLGYAFTRCAPISVVGQPYQEFFDNYTTGISSSAYSPIEYPYISYPDCWSFLNLHALVGYPDGTLPAAFLSNKSTLIVWGNSLHLVNSKVTPLYAVLPEFVEHLRFLKLTFSYKYSTLKPVLSVGYMTNPSDGNTYHEVQFCPNSNTNNFTTLNIDYSTLGLDPDSNYCIAFRVYDSISGWLNTALENVKVELIPNAFPAPTQLNVSDITANSAVLDWTNGNDENHWVVEYRLAARSEWTDSMEVFSHPVLLDSLAANTEYDVRVKSVYGDSRTMCSAYTATAFTTLDDTSVPDYGGFDQRVAVRPNPANQYIDVIMDEVPGPCQITLYDSHSRMVGEYNTVENNTRIPLGHLASGVYFVQIQSDNIKVTRKFIKE